MTVKCGHEECVPGLHGSFNELENEIDDARLPASNAVASMKWLLAQIFDPKLLFKTIHTSEAEATEPVRRTS